MAVTTQPNQISDFVKWEVDRQYTREARTLISGQNLVVGTVLGKITASAKFTAYNPGATDGSQNAAAILLETTDASGGDKTCPVLERGPAIIADKTQLIWGAGVTTDTHKNNGIAALAALGMIARTSV